MHPAPPPAIFDRAARRLRRDRMGGEAARLFESHVADLVGERIDAVAQAFARALVVNTGFGILADRLSARGMTVTETDFAPGLAAARGAVPCDEDRLAVDARAFDLVVAPARFDLVVAPAGFDTIDDLPGALLLARRAMTADGLFLAVMTGAPGLPALRQAVMVADGNRAVARLHPQVDVRAGGDLLVRAGFALPVADIETVTLSYQSVGALIADLRATGTTNVLGDRYPVSRGWMARLAAAFADQGNGRGRTDETVSLLVLTGWSPAAAEAATTDSSGRSAGGIGNTPSSSGQTQRSAVA